MTCSVHHGLTASGLPTLQVRSQATLRTYLDTKRLGLTNTLALTTLIIKIACSMCSTTLQKHHIFAMHRTTGSTKPLTYLTVLKLVLILPHRTGIVGSMSADALPAAACISILLMHSQCSAMTANNAGPLMCQKLTVKHMKRVV